MYLLRVGFIQATMYLSFNFVNAKISPLRVLPDMMLLTGDSVLMTLQTPEPVSSGDILKTPSPSQCG